MKKQLISMVTALSLLTACGGNPKTTAEAEKIDYTVEQFADLQILRYRVPGFEDLSLKQKELVYYLTEAALQGRDILFDQNGKYNLTIRRGRICRFCLRFVSVQRRRRDVDYRYLQRRRERRREQAGAA